MISVVHNETLGSVDILLDVKGAALLIAKLNCLLNDTSIGHLHLYGTNDDTGVATWSPYKHKTVFSELVLNLSPSEAWSETAE